MINMFRSFLMLLVLLAAAACGGAYDSETGQVTEALTWIQCPNPPPGTVVVSSWHSCGERKLYCYANGMGYGSVSWPKKATCAPSNTYPDPSCYEFTTSASLVCSP